MKTCIILDGPLAGQEIKHEALEPFIEIPAPDPRSIFGPPGVFLYKYKAVITGQEICFLSYVSEHELLKPDNW